MKNFIRKFKEKYTEFYAFKYLVHTLVFGIVGIILLMFADLYRILGFFAFGLFIIWIILVAIPNNRIFEIRQKILKELEVDKLVNDRYIKEFIKEKK